MRNSHGSFRTGMENLLANHRSWLARRRVGLLSHPAAVNTAGAPDFVTLASAIGPKLKALFGPEHGFYGTAGAGVAVSHQNHPFLRRPVYSLYGSQRRLTADMLKQVDVIIFDIQDIAARCYTYVSTLRNVLEDAARHDKTVIVADRPVPLPNTVDGPMLDDGFSSFVGCIPAPLSYGMTPGETALWLREQLGLALDLRVAEMRGYRRQPARQTGWPQWIPPSPAILSWESAWCYTATVFTEALPAIDCGRSSGLPFQVIGASWMKSKPVCNCLARRRLPGVAFYPHQFRRHKSEPAQVLDGIRLCITDPDRFRPVTTSIEIISCLQELYGYRRIWNSPGVRPDFFDKLYGAGAVRESLMAGIPPGKIASSWKKAGDVFLQERQKHLLYRPEKTRRND